MTHRSQSFVFSMGVINCFVCSLLVFKFVFILMFCADVCILSSTPDPMQSASHDRGPRSTNRLNEHLEKAVAQGMMDSKFDFDFKWDDEPPEFINQLDVEIKWEDDDSDSKPSKVSIQNLTMDEGISMDPMTKMITTIANTSFHEMNGLAAPSSLPHALAQNFSDTVASSNMCSCEEIQSLLKLREVLKGDTGQRGRRGRRGFKGVKGDPGLSIVGPKGEPGDSGLLPYHLLNPEATRQKGEPGPRGPPGPPGTCSARCPNTNPTAGPPDNLQRSAPDSAAMAKPNYRIVPGALVFKTLPSMIQMSTWVMLGSVAFVEESEEFYGKVTRGWKKFQMTGSLTT